MSDQTLTEDGGIVLTPGQIAAWVRPGLSREQLQRIADAIPASPIPEVIGELAARTLAAEEFTVTKGATVTLPAELAGIFLGLSAAGGLVLSSPLGPVPVTRCCHAIATFAEHRPVCEACRQPLPPCFAVDTDIAIAREDLHVQVTQ